MLLEVKDLHAFYGKSHVLRGVNIHLGKGEIVSVLGRNGAGRSTLVKAIMGQVRATGSIRFKNEQVLGLPSFQLACRGIGYVPEDRQIFGSLTVEQNLLLGMKTKQVGAGRLQPWLLQDAYQLFPQLLSRRLTKAGVLSGGQQQMLALCRTLMGNPELIMIDEPTEGLAPTIIPMIEDYLKTLKTRGIAILLIEQRLSITLNLSQRIYVLGRGETVFEGSPTAFSNANSVHKEWLAM